MNPIDLLLTDGEDRLLCRSHDKPRYENFDFSVTEQEWGYSSRWEVTFICGVKLVAIIEGDDLYRFIRVFRGASDRDKKNWMGLEVLMRWERTLRIHDGN